jgi:prephenate dehydratase
MALDAMQRFPAPARPIVADMNHKAAQQPEHAIAFQGAPGANSQIALESMFPHALPLPCFSFEDALEAVQEGRAVKAMIPIENSLHGRVADMHFLLPESGLVIVGEFFLPIHYALMGKGALGDVREAVSHPQALGQCRRWLRAHSITPQAYADTAGAAALVAERQEAGLAAIAPIRAAEIYGLDILATNIADSADNVTRFVVLAREAEPLAQESELMTSLIFEVKNIPAALYKALGGFATNGVNITKLESYQRHASFSATEFYADIVGSPHAPPVARALEELAFQCKRVRLLGTYPQALVRE